MTRGVRTVRISPPTQQSKQMPFLASLAAPLLRGIAEDAKQNSGCVGCELRTLRWWFDSDARRSGALGFLARRGFPKDPALRFVAFLFDHL